MDEELLALKWNNHQSTFLRIIRNLRPKVNSEGESSHTDVTLACDGSFFPVHKFVLSTCSDYFSEIFRQIKCANPIIVLKDIARRHLEYLLDYMYIGEINVRQKDLASLVNVAECLKIKGLAVPDDHESYQKSTSEEPCQKRVSTKSHRHILPSVAGEDQLVSVKSEKDTREETNSTESPTELGFTVKTEPLDSLQNFEDAKNEIFASETRESIEYEGGSCTEGFQSLSPSELRINNLKNVPGPSGVQMDLEDTGWFSDATQEMVPPIASQIQSPSSFNQQFIPSPKAFSLSKRLKKRLSHLKAVKSDLTQSSGNKVNYLCPHCPYSCQDGSNFKRHVQVHTGEKPYHCPFCKYSSIHSSNLKTHIRNRHSRKLIGQSLNCFTGKQLRSNNLSFSSLQLPSVSPTTVDSLL